MKFLARKSTPPAVTKKVPRIAAVTAMALSAAVILAGCVSVPDNETPGASASTTSSVTVGQSVDPTTMDPMQQRETTTQNVLQHIYSRLIQRNVDDPKKFDGVLAKSWKIVDDTTYEFVLRDDVTFSDGSTLDANDVKYSVDYLLGKVTGDPALASSSFVGLEGAEVVDDNTVRFNMSAPTPLFMAELELLYIIPDGSVDEKKDALASTPIGSGPYTLEKWDRNIQVVLKARDDYFEGKPAIDTVVFQTIADASARLAGLKAGDIDIITNLTPDSIDEVNASDNAAVEKTPSARVASIWLNTLIDGPLQSAKVRLALNHAIDVQTIIDTVMGGYGSRVATMIPEYFAGYDPANKPLAYDPELAKKLLAEAGYAKGFSMEMMLPAGRYPFAEQVSQAIQSYLKDVGVDVKLDIVEFGVFADATNSGNVPESYYGAWGNAAFNPIDEYLPIVHTGDSGYSLFSDASVDKLIDEASETIDQDKQDALISQIEKKMLEEAPFIYLYAQVDLYGVSNRINWKPQMSETINLYNASIK